MGELISYKCPSCGAGLKPAQDSAQIVCSFCGSVFERSLSEGEQMRISAAKLAESAEKYKADLAAFTALKEKISQLTVEVNYLSKKNTDMPLWMVLMLPIQGFAAVMIAFYFISAYKMKSTPMMIFTGALFTALVISVFVVQHKKRILKSNADSLKEQLKTSLIELTAARIQLKKFEQSFDIDAIPQQYRNDAALDYIIGLFKSGQASKLGEAFRRYDEQSHFKNMEALQREQVEIQKKQLEIMDRLADYDFDDTYDDDDFTLHETLKAFKDQ